MAKKRLSAATYVTRGYGQVEPNHLSAQRTGEIYAQLPCKKDILALDNGMFMKYDYANGEVNTTGAGEWMLVYNEVKIYDEREIEEDFSMIKENYTSGEMTPRLFKTHEGDIYTTNCIMAGEAEPVAGDVYAPTETTVTEGTATYKVGILTKTEAATGMRFEVAKVYTLADGQKAVKLMRIA